MTLVLWLRTELASASAAKRQPAIVWLILCGEADALRWTLRSRCGACGDRGATDAYDASASTDASLEPGPDVSSTLKRRLHFD